MARFARWLLCFACIALTLVMARAASARGAFCHDRAISLHPPPPVIPARDVRLEPPSVTPPCLSDGLDLDEAAAAPPRTPSPHADTSFVTDRALVPAPSSLPRFGGERVAFAEAEAWPLSPGHAQGVFHPPRG